MADIISLCCVSDNTDKKELCRIADYENGSFVPYTFDPRQSFYANDRDLVFGSPMAVKDAPGTFSVYEWEATLTREGKWWTTVAVRDDINWIEVIFLDADGIGNIIKGLKKGLPISETYDGKHDLLICDQNDEISYDSIYLSPNELICRDSRLFFRESVTEIRIGKTNKTYIYQAKCRYPSLTMKNYLSSSDAFHLEKWSPIKTAEEITADVVNGNIKRFLGNAFSRDDKRLVRDALARLSDDSVSDLLMEKLNCTKEAARKYIQEYIESANIKLDDSTANSLIETLVNSDSELVRKLDEKISQEWHLKHEQELSQIRLQHQQEEEQARQDLERIKEEFAETEELIRINRDGLTKIKEEEKQALQKTQDAEKLYQDIEQKIRERLSHVHEDMAGALVDYALMSNLPLNTTATVPIPREESVMEQDSDKDYIAIVPDVDNVSNDTMLNALQNAREYWYQLCGRNRWSECLPVLTAAVFAANQPVIITGEGAEIVVDMMASTVYGHKPLRIMIVNTDSISKIIQFIQQNNHEVICVSNGLGSAYMVVRELMMQFPDSRFILTAKHEEMLTLEPGSLFNTFLLIHSDYFYNGFIPDVYPSVDCTQELYDERFSTVPSRALKETRAKTGKWYGDGYYPMLLKNRFARVLYLLGQVDKKIHDNTRIAKLTEIEFLVAHWLKMVRSAEDVVGLIQDIDLDAAVKQEIVEYLNAGNR